MEVDPEMPLLAFDLREGKAEMYIDGNRQDMWLPVMFAQEEMDKWGVTEPGIKRNMIMVEVNDKMKGIPTEMISSRMKEEYNFMQYKQTLKESCGERELIVGVYVQIRENNLLNWTLAASGATKRRKTSIPKQWAEIGFHAGPSTYIFFDVNPDNIKFKPNSCVSKWMSFDEMQLMCTKEVTPDQKSRMMFRYRVRTSKKVDVFKLYIEMIIMPKQLVYESLPEAKKATVESGAGLTIPFWGLSSPISWDGEDKSYNITVMPMFGIFNSQITMNDAIVRRIVHEVIRQAEAGSSTTKIGELNKFLENPSRGKIFKERSLHLPLDPEKEVIYLSDTRSSGNTIKINNRSIKVNKGSKYDRQLKIPHSNIERLKQNLPDEASKEDAHAMLKIISASISNNTAATYKSIRRTMLSACPGRNALANPKFGDDALLMTRLAKLPNLKKSTVKQYMKSYKTLVLMEGGVPHRTSQHYKQLIKGLTNMAHDPIAQVAASHRKAYSIPSLRIMGHAIASTKWSKFRKQAVFTALLVAFWGRLRLCELLCKSPFSFQPKNAFLRNDLKFIMEKNEVKGMQLWIRNAKVPDPMGVLVEIPSVKEMQDICPVRAMKKYLKMRDGITNNGETPLLIDDTSFIMSARKFTDYISKAIEKLDISYKDVFDDLKGHSLRSGVPTAMQTLSEDIDPKVSKYLGRWKGKSVNLYLKDKAAASAARLAVAESVKNCLI